MVYLGLIVHANHIIAKEETITSIHDLTTPRNIHEERSYQGLAWFYIPPLVIASAMLTVFIHCTSKIETEWTGELQTTWQKITNVLCTTLTLLQNFIIHFEVRNELYTIQVQAFLFQGWRHNNIEGEMWWKIMRKFKGRLCNPTYRKQSKMIDELLQNSFWTPCDANLFHLSHHSIYLTENEENSRTSSFEEGAPDAAHNVAQEPIFYCYGKFLLEAHSRVFGPCENP